MDEHMWWNGTIASGSINGDLIETVDGKPTGRVIPNLAEDDGWGDFWAREDCTKACPLGLHNHGRVFPDPTTRPVPIRGDDPRILEAFNPPVVHVTIPVADYAELLANTERGVFWRKVAEGREDCYTRMVRAELTRDQNGQDFEDAFAELEDAEKKILALEANRDEWMTMARDAHNDSKKFVEKANGTMVERNRALTQRNAALFFVGLLAGAHLIHALFYVGAL